ncbi:MAG TPA: TetR family transcriptional regulator [Acidimicrobiales bacterium]|nr:TetR family transcriptional regulator [Acidimicrobiales bacterium]
MPTTRPRVHGPSATRRREALLQATRELAAERGAGAVTHRAVAKRAGLPPSTTSYFFDSIDDLVSEALVVFAAESSQRIADLAVELPDGSSPADVADAAAARLTATPTSDALAEIETYLAAARDPALRPAVAEAMATFERATVAALRAAGAARATAGARAFVALSDGFLVRHLADPRPDDAAQLRRALLALSIFQLLTDEEVQTFERRLGGALLSEEDPTDA